MAKSPQLTLLVTLKDRAGFTERLYQYFKNINYPFPVIFADGSLGDEHEIFFANAAQQDFDFSYVRFPPDLTFKDYYKKCFESLTLIKTPYVMVVDNDDFPIGEGQQEALSFLEKNADYVGCNGRVPGFSLSPDSHQPFGKHILCMNYYSASMDVAVPLDQEEPVERIKAYLKDFYSIYYSIFRTESVLKTFQQIYKLNFSDLGIVELFFSYHQLAQGKIHTIDSTTYMRQQGSSQSASSQKGWFDRLFYTNWLKDLKHCIDQVALESHTHENKSLEWVKESLYKDFTQRFKRRFIQNDWYFLKNPHLFFNIKTLKLIALLKIFRVSPWLGEKISYVLLERNLKQAFRLVSTFVSKV